MNAILFTAILIASAYLGKWILGKDSGQAKSEFVAGNLVICYRDEKIVFTKHHDADGIMFLSDWCVEKVTLPRGNMKDKVHEYFKNKDDCSDTMQLLTNWNVGDCAFVRFDPLCAKGLIEAQIKLAVLCEID